MKQSRFYAENNNKKVLCFDSLIERNTFVAKTSGAKSITVSQARSKLGNKLKSVPIQNRMIITHISWI